MTYYQKWMASPRHLAVFKTVARLGFMPSLVLGTSVLIGPWLWWALEHNCSKTAFGFGLLLLLLPGAFCLVAATRYFPVAGGNIWMTVEVKRGVLALHMWKTFPSKAVLCDVATKAVQIGLELGCTSICIESPLLVRPGRLQMWGSELTACLAVFGPQVTVQVVQPKRMMFLRAALFSVTRKLMRYDLQNKHLPAAKGTFSCETAGFILTLY